MIPTVRDELHFVLRAARELPVEQLPRLLGELEECRCTTKVYVAHSPNHEMYSDEIAAEIQNFGGNTIANRIRGHGRPYRDIVRWSAKKLKVRHEDTATISEIEIAILTKQEQKLEMAYQKMNDEQRTHFLKDMQIGTGCGIPTSLTIQSIQTMIRSQGFRPYIWLVKNSNWLWRVLTGAGLSLAKNKLSTKMLSWILAPEVGIAVTVLDVVRFAAGPARRVLIPCVIHIATMRQQRLRRLRELNRICFPEIDHAG